jgi:hypothetical protein
LFRNDDESYLSGNRIDGSYETRKTNKKERGNKKVMNSDLDDQLSEPE